MDFLVNMFGTSKDRVILIAVIYSVKYLQYMIQDKTMPFNISTL